MTKIAVEQGLRPFRQALKEAGFMVVEITKPDEIDTLAPHAVVVSGMDADFMGIQDAREAPVITAAGRTPEEVVNQVRRSLGPKE